MPGRLPTHRDIARRAQVSPATVSYALRDDPRISAAVRARVRRAAERLGYRPNPMVSALMAQRSAARPPAFRATLACLHTVPLDSTLEQHPSMRRARRGLEQRAAELGYLIRDFQWHERGISPARLRQILLAQGVVGIIVWFFPIPERGQLGLDFDWSPFAVVTMGDPLPDACVAHVAVDYFKVGTLPCRELARLGYRRPGLAISSWIDDAVEGRISAGFVTARHAAGDEQPVPVFRFTGSNLPAFVHWFERWRPDVLLNFNMELHEALLARGLRMPEDFGRVYLDYFPPYDVAGVDQNWELVGAAAVDQISALLHNNQRGVLAHPRTVLIDPAWHPGRTVQRRPAAPTHQR